MWITGVQGFDTLPCGFRMIRRWSIRHELTIWISWSMLIWWPDSDLTGVGMMQWIFNVFQYQVVFIWFVSSLSIETIILCWSFLMDQSSSCLVSCQVQDSSGQSYWWNKQTNQAKIDQQQQQQQQQQRQRQRQRQQQRQQQHWSIRYGSCLAAGPHSSW